MLSVVLGCAFTALVLSGLVSLSVHIVEKTRTQIASDAAVLASIFGGEQAATLVAARNGAILMSFQVNQNSTHTVQVRRGSQTATSSARDTWADQLPTMKP